MPAYRAMPATGGNVPGRSSSCRKCSACTSTSRTSAGGSRRPATSRSRPSCTRGRATPSKIHGHVEARSRKSSSKVPDAQVMGDLDACRRLREGQRQGRDGAARHHRLLLGRPHRLHVRRAQPEREGRGRLVRPHGSRVLRRATRRRSTSRAQIKAPVLGPVRRRRPGHSERHGREDVRGAEGGGQHEVRVS